MCWESVSERVSNSTLQSPLSLTCPRRTMESSSPTRSFGSWMTPMCTESPSTRQVNAASRCPLILFCAYPRLIFIKVNFLFLDLWRQLDHKTDQWSHFHLQPQNWTAFLKDYPHICMGRTKASWTGWSEHLSCVFPHRAVICIYMSYTCFFVSLSCKCKF